MCFCVFAGMPPDLRNAVGLDDISEADLLGMMSMMKDGGNTMSPFMGMSDPEEMLDNLPEEVCCLNLMLAVWASKFLGVCSLWKS